MIDTPIYEGEDFDAFLTKLINYEFSTDSKLVGIAKLTIDKGYQFLSNKQKYVLEEAIKPYIIQSCIRGCKIEWYDMYEAYDNGGMCEYCYGLSEKYKAE